MNPKTYTFAGIILFVVIAGLVFYVKNDPSNQNNKQDFGKPQSPFQVSMETKSVSGNSIVLAVTVGSEVGLPEATLNLHAFDGLTVITDTPANFILLGGERRTFDVEARLNNSGTGKCTAEVIAKFGDGTTFVENASISFKAGKEDSADHKVDFYKSRVNVQNVPAQ